MVSIVSKTDLAHLIQGYRLCAKTEGKSDKTITIVASSVRYLEDFLLSLASIIPRGEHDHVHHYGLLRTLTICPNTSYAALYFLAKHRLL